MMPPVIQIHSPKILFVTMMTNCWGSCQQKDQKSLKWLDPCVMNYSDQLAWYFWYFFQCIPTNRLKWAVMRFKIWSITASLLHFQYVKTFEWGLTWRCWSTKYCRIAKFAVFCINVWYAFKCGHNVQGKVIAEIHISHQHQLHAESVILVDNKNGLDIWRGLSNRVGY